jgi:UDP-N-acetylmuramate: L-alanyl-gamma-D-glutamyl-meso-diaminopimelate ligase
MPSSAIRRAAILAMRLRCWGGAGDPVGCSSKNPVVLLVSKGKRGVLVGGAKDAARVQSRLPQLNFNLDRNMHIHILGICGTFMAGLAQLARAAGHRVTGCDSSVYPPMSTQLEAAQIELVEGYDAAQIAFEPDCYVVGNAISRGNPLLEEILDRGLPYLSGPQWLAEHVLKGPLGAGRRRDARQDHDRRHAGVDSRRCRAESRLPDRRRAEELRRFGAAVRATAGLAVLVIEADEYDSAFCDKRSKFIHYPRERRS